MENDVDPRNDFEKELFIYVEEGNVDKVLADIENYKQDIDVNKRNVQVRKFSTNRNMRLEIGVLQFFFAFSHRV